VGYCGGTTPAPTYRNIGDHAEALQLHFDPARVTFEELLALFWQGHDPTYGKASQYRAALFCNDEAQLESAQRSATELQAQIGERLVTEILLGKPFHSAEAYHQKWRLRQRTALFKALLEHYPDEPTMLASTAAAKANAYVGGHGDSAWLERELPLLTKTA
jgi:peptide-methionine (S)-S-oxide reductase